MVEPVAKFTSEIKRRGRQRRWWMLAALVLCVGGYLGWRTQNFGDPRYVGRWNVVQDYDGRMSTQIEFFNNGTGRMVQLIELHGELNEDPVMDFRWGVEQELLLIDNDPTAQQLTLLQRIELQMNEWLSGWQPTWQTRDYRVTVVGPERLMLIAANAGADNEHFEIVKVEE